MPFFRDMIKDILHEELEAIANENAGNGADPSTPSADPKAASNNDDKSTPETPPAEPSTPPAEPTKPDDKDAFNVELRKMIKKEVRDYAADALNKERASGGANKGVDVDEAFASLLGFKIQKGDK